MTDPNRVSIPVRLSLAWAALMFLYIYNDYFAMYLPGTIDMMSEGTMGPLGPATPTIMVVVSTLLAIPALMILLSSALPRPVSRWINVVFGLIYTLIQALTFVGSALFYQIVVALEIGVTLYIIWTAFNWRAPSQS